MFVLNLLMSVQAAQQNPGIERLMAGIESYENGNYGEAIFKLEIALIELPQDDKENTWEAHFYLGLSYYLSGEDEEARKEFNKAKDIFNKKLPDPDLHSPKIVKLFKEALIITKPENEGMVFVKGGCFEMGDIFGDGQKDERPVHEVCVDDYYIGKYEVTVGEFREFFNKSGYRTEAETGGGVFYWTGKKWKKDSRKNWESPGFSQTDNHPVVGVSWNDAQEYMKWLSKKTGRKYRLPTEAEWEYAVKSGGKKVRYAWGNGEPYIKGKKAANIADESAKKKFGWMGSWEGYDDGYVYTSLVGNFEPNELGLYDMTGNVWEWCSDWYSSDYYKKSQSQSHNPEGPSSGSGRVVRGGGWNDFPRSVRASDRGRQWPDSRSDILGFRLAF